MSTQNRSKFSVGSSLCAVMGLTVTTFGGVFASTALGDPGPASPPSSNVSKGLSPDVSPFTDYRQQSPGTVHRIRAADLPRPFATRSVDRGPTLVPRPAGAWPRAP